MGVTSALVLFAVIWFMTFLIVIPIRLQTQGDVGIVVPENHNLKKKAWITTAISAVLWCIIAGTIISGKISVRDLDWFDRMGGASQSRETDG
jgi:predicted secreted protein